MMFGLRDCFDYHQCADCLSLQIAVIPDSELLRDYYPDGYYSHLPFETRSASLAQRIKRLAVKLRDTHVVKGTSFLGGLLESLRPADVKITSLKGLALSSDSQILDLGCGAAAALLNRLARMGFKNLVGVDPFIPTDIVTEAGVEIRKCEIGDVQGKFDLIMMHHSFEHVPSPAQTLSHVRMLLKEDGRCLIRIPTPSSAAYDDYGCNWVQLDAPRHLTLISRIGMETLAKRCEMFVERSFDDSSAFQFIGSELYIRDIPLVDQAPEKWYSVEQIKDLETRASVLNLAHRGDQSCFILRPL